jgi:hypothetical protein
MLLLVFITCLVCGHADLVYYKNKAKNMYIVHTKYTPDILINEFAKVASPKGDTPYKSQGVK